MLWTLISLLLSGLNIPYFKKLIWEHLITEEGQKACSHPTSVHHPLQRVASKPLGSAMWLALSFPTISSSLPCPHLFLPHSLYLFISLSFFLIGLFSAFLTIFLPPLVMTQATYTAQNSAKPLGGLKALPADGWHPSSGNASFNLRLLKKKVQVSFCHSLFTVPEGTILNY